MTNPTLFIAAVGFGKNNPDILTTLTANRFSVNQWPGERRMGEDELALALQNVDACIVTGEKITAKVLETASRLQLVIRMGSGSDNVDIEEAHKKNMVVATTPEPSAGAVAELTLALILNLLRGIGVSDRALRTGQWQRPRGSSLSELTVGLLGLGRIGSRVAEILLPLGPKILACDINPNSKALAIPQLQWCKPAELLSSSDIVSVHIPLTSQTRKYFGPAEWGQMRPGAFFINTARGEIVDEESLVQALKSGHLAGAALDVYAQEPYAGPLIALDNVLLTAHIGSAVASCRKQMEVDAVNELMRFFTHQPLRWPVS